MRFYIAAAVVLFLTSCKKNPDNNSVNIVNPPNRPAYFTAKIVSSTRVVLEWVDSSSNEDGFLIERKGKGLSFVVLGSTNADSNHFEDVDVQTDSQYTYRIYAFNLSGKSEQAANELTINIPRINISGVSIGDKLWSDANLDVSQYLNGDPIPQVSDPQEWATLTTGAWCWYDNDSSTNASSYGKLYNWYAVNDRRGLAPDGWHVPDESEWNKLIASIDPFADTTCQVNCTQSSVAGADLKESGLAHWFSPNNGANNNAGFTALPGGGRDTDGTYFFKGNYGHWWSNGSYNSTDAFIRTLSYSGTSFKKELSYKKLGYSVRVVKN